jgi:serine protease AprX
MTVRRAPRAHATFAASLTLLALLGLIASAAPAAHHAPTRSVVVQAASAQEAADLVEAVRGEVTDRYEMIGGVAAKVPEDGLAVLETGRNVVITADVELEPTDAEFAPTAFDTQLDAIDPGPALARNAGAGVGVALIDTGVNPTADLHAPRLVTGPDLSRERDGVDRFGHGTFMAGLIAGDGTASAGEPVQHRGVAPGATVVAVKVAGSDGGTDLSTVLSGFQWVIDHADEHEIRVVSLSFGVPVALPPFANPLDAAAEATWASGITVVAAAGNEGRAGVTAPGDDPWVVTVGATDTKGTPGVRDDTIPEWSGRERVVGVRKPELHAPGVSVVSLRAAGSTVDTEHPDARIGDTYFRGSGTSMSTAMVAGAVAVLTAEHPAATPDDVKGALVDGATPIRGGRVLSVAGAERAEPQRDWWQDHPAAIRLPGDRMPWARGKWSATRWTMTRWTMTRWTMTRWTDESWHMTRWTMTRWTDESWHMTRWTATRWTATRWTASRWTSGEWTVEPSP